MAGTLPLNVDDLLHHRTVESDRIEYKAGWNPDAVMRTLCAFANDFENLSGGYIILGQDCDAQGQPVFPPVGLPANQLDCIQRELLGYCQLLQPTYFPSLSLETYAGRNLIVLWAPGGLNRPYKAPRAVTAKVKEYHYYIRRYSSTIELKSNSEDEQELLRLTASIPFDDRQCRQADVDDLRPGLLQTYLKEVGSDLHKEASKRPVVEIGRLMNIVDGADEFVKPRNVGVLFFHDVPRKYLPGTQIDVVIFPDGPGGDELVEKVFHGPLHEQIRDVLRYIDNSVIREKIIKHPDRAKATRFFNYPLSAIKEAVVNAVYHRGYDQREPVEVRISPEEIIVVSYPGPDSSIRIEALQGERVYARRYRNRRIGEFLKELELTEGRCTGIPKIRAAMKKNGSPVPKFVTDAGRTYFAVELPVHPQLHGVVFRDEAQVGVHDGAHEEVQVKAHDTSLFLTETEDRILRLLGVKPKTRSEISADLGVNSRTGHLYKSISRLQELNFIEFTIPDKPRSRNQQLRITPAGQAWLAKAKKR
jgi:ATP-dependent DNA helicase RecG